jgi:hypothetical protein
MDQLGSALKGGFIHRVEHIRSVERMKAMGLSIDGLNHVDHQGNDYVVLSVEDVHNLIPTEGLNYILGAALTGVSPLTAWFIAPFEGNYTPVEGVTAANFTANATENTTYDEATRQAWTPGTITDGAVDNSAAKAIFTMNATKTIYGVGMLSASAKSATSGKIVSAARFATSKSVVDNDVLNVTNLFTLANP